MSLFAELKRRNVYRVAALYVVVAWLVLQVTDVLASVLVLPSWFGRLVFVLLGAGFPVALVLAWAFELTPEGIRREQSEPGSAAVVPVTGRRMDLLIIGLLLVALGWFAWHHDWRRGAESTTGGAIRSLVVLPLENLMNDPGQAYFVSGMHEALITELSRIDGLHVISRTSARALADAGLSVPEIGERLGVDAVVEGSVLKAGDTVRITVQLIEAASDRHLWADNFDRRLEDILGLYGEVTREITQQVQLTLSADQQAEMARVKTVNPAVYEGYLEGRFLCDQWRPAGMERGLKVLRDVLAIDPAHAPTLSQLALCLQYSAFFGYLRPLEVFDEARTASERAVGLDPGLDEAWVALAGVQYYLEFNPRQALESLTQALQSDPNSVRALMHLSWLNGESGRFEAALAHNRYALQLDPLSTIVINAMGQVHYLARDYEAARASYERAVELDRSDPSMHYGLARVLEAQGRFDLAEASHRRAIELSEGESLYRAALAYCLARSERPAEARRLLEELRAERRASPYDLAIVHLGLEEKDLALDYLERAFAARDSHMVYLNREAKFDPLRGEPRFQALIDAMDYPEPDTPLATGS